MSAALTVLGSRRGGKSMLLNGRNEQLSGTSAGPNGTVNLTPYKRIIVCHITRIDGHAAAMNVDERPDA